MRTHAVAGVMLGGLFALSACSSNTPSSSSSDTAPEQPPVSSPPSDLPVQSSPPPTQSPPAETGEPAPSSMHIDSTPYQGPPVSVRIVQAKRLPPISTALIEITAPTGGWTLNLDKGEVVGETARIFLTLEGPGEDEWVTPALVKHTAEFTSEKPPFTKAEVYVHLAQRGIHTLTTNYRLAASNE